MFPSRLIYDKKIFVLNVDIDDKDLVACLLLTEARQLTSTLWVITKLINNENNCSTKLDSIPLISPSEVNDSTKKEYVKLALEPHNDNLLSISTINDKLKDLSKLYKTVTEGSSNFIRYDVTSSMLIQYMLRQGLKYISKLSTITDLKMVTRNLDPTSTLAVKRLIEYARYMYGLSYFMGNVDVERALNSAVPITSHPLVAQSLTPEVLYAMLNEFGPFDRDECELIAIKSLARLIGSSFDEHAKIWKRQYYTSHMKDVDIENYLDMRWMTSMINDDYIDPRIGQNLYFLISEYSTSGDANFLAFQGASNYDVFGMMLDIKKGSNNPSRWPGVTPVHYDIKFRKYDKSHTKMLYESLMMKLRRYSWGHYQSYLIIKFILEFIWNENVSLINLMVSGYLIENKKVINALVARKFDGTPKVSSIARAFISLCGILQHYNSKIIEITRELQILTLNTGYDGEELDNQTGFLVLSPFIPKNMKGTFPDGNELLALGVCLLNDVEENLRNSEPEVRSIKNLFAMLSIPVKNTIKNSIKFASPELAQKLTARQFSLENQIQDAKIPYITSDWSSTSASLFGSQIKFSTAELNYNLLLGVKKSLWSFRDLSNPDRIDEYYGTKKLEMWTSYPLRIIMDNTLIKTISKDEYNHWMTPSKFNNSDVIVPQAKCNYNNGKDTILDSAALHRFMKDPINVELPRDIGSNAKVDLINQIIINIKPKLRRMIMHEDRLKKNLLDIIMSHEMSASPQLYSVIKTMLERGYINKQASDVILSAIVN